MIDLSLDLPQELYPLAWLIGQWRGWGTAPLKHSQQEGANQYVIQEASFVAVGTSLKQSTMTWAAIPRAEGPEMMDDAPTGLRQLSRGALLWREEAHWKVVASTPASVDQEACSRIEVSTEGGPLERPALWQAQSLGPRVMMGYQPDTPTEEGEIISLPMSRMFGLVGGELFWACEEVSGSDTIPIFSARLARQVVGENTTAPPNVFNQPSVDFNPDEAQLKEGE